MWLDRAKSSSNLKVIAGGNCDDRKGYFVEPTIIESTDPRDPIMSEAQTFFISIVTHTLFICLQTLASVCSTTCVCVSCRRSSGLFCQFMFTLRTTTKRCCSWSTPRPRTLWREPCSLRTSETRSSIHVYRTSKTRTVFLQRRHTIVVLLSGVKVCLNLLRNHRIKMLQNSPENQHHTVNRSC